MARKIAPALMMWLKLTEEKFSGERIAGCDRLHLRVYEAHTLLKQRVRTRS